MSILQMPGDTRKLVRNAVRNHERCGEILAHFGVTYVNNLTNAQLMEACQSLEIDAAAIVAGAPATMERKPRVERVADAPMEDAPMEETPMTTEASGDASTIDADAAALRRELASAMVEGNFDSVTARIGALLTEARKPAEIVTVTVAQGDAPPAYVAKPIAKATWGALFGVTGPRASQECHVWDSPEAPAIDSRYRWPEGTTLSALTCLARQRHPWLFGPPGTGKTTFAEQFAARLGRPFRLIGCDDTTEAPELIGMRGPHDGRTIWLDGILTSAIRIPGCVILIDEPTIARAGAIMVMQSVLANRYLFVKETGERVQVAKGVLFLAADNTNGTGGGAANGYEDTRRLNAAFLDRFGVKLKIDYMPRDTEISVLVDHTGCTLALAKLLVDVAGATRSHSSAGRLGAGLGLRRLISWAEQLTDGIPPRVAFESAVLNGAAAEDHETLEQICLLAFDAANVAGAMGAPTTTARERTAQSQFASGN